MQFIAGQTQQFYGVDGADDDLDEEEKQHVYEIELARQERMKQLYLKSEEESTLKDEKRKKGA